jgi:hypothetical protein
MRNWFVTGALMGPLALACGAGAAPLIDIRGVAARVVIIPEARSTIVVSVIQKNARLPLRISRLGGKVTISGDIGHHVHGCPMLAAGRAVEIRGRGMIAVNDLPRIAIRAPMDVRLTTGEAVFGAVGRTDSLDLANRGCGDWLIGNVRGHLRLNEAGPGRARIGSAGSADLSVVGSGAIATRRIAGGLMVISSGDGDIDIASASGAINLRVAGSGDISIPEGDVSEMSVAIAGSGNVRFGGVARTLNASIVGPGDITVGRVTGSVTRRIFGPGQVRLGAEGVIRPGPAPDR